MLVAFAFAAIKNFDDDEISMIHTSDETIDKGHGEI
jgi:hypothetical protein